MRRLIITLCACVAFIILFLSAVIIGLNYLVNGRNKVIVRDEKRVEQTSEITKKEISSNVTKEETLSNKDLELKYDIMTHLIDINAIQVDTYNQVESRMRAEFDKHKVEVEDLKSEHESKLNDTKLEYEIEIQKYKTELAEKDKELEKLKSKKVEDSSDTINDRIDTLIKEINRLKAENDKLKKDGSSSKEKDERIKELEHRLNESENILKVMVASISNTVRR